MYVYTLVRINLRLHLELTFFSSSASYACWQFVLLRAGSCVGKLCHHLLLPHLSILLPATPSTSSRSWYCKFGAVWAGQMLRSGLFSHSTLCRFSEALCTPPSLELSWSSLGMVESDCSPLSPQPLCNRGDTSAFCTRDSLGQYPRHPSYVSSMLTASSPQESLLHP